MKNQKIVIIIAWLVTAALMLGVGFAWGHSGEGARPESSALQAPAEDTLQDTGLTLTVARSEEGKSFSPDELGGNFQYGLTYHGTNEVRISLHGQEEKLEDALNRGDISEEEIFFRARQDARSGKCRESFEALAGVSFFTYQYDGYSIRLTYDVLAAPDGKEYCISEMAVCAGSAGEELVPSVDYRDPETGEQLTLENWGVQFETENVSAAGATVRVQQSGGQQLGQLEVFAYRIEPAGEEDSGNAPTLVESITMDGSTTFAIDWSDTYGQLTGGSYRLCLWVRDVYDETQVHPFAAKFRDWQQYEVELIVP